MTVWVLFVWIGVTVTPWAYHSQADCEEARETYKRAVCVRVVVPKK